MKSVLMLTPLNNIKVWNFHVIQYCLKLRSPDWFTAYLGFHIQTLFPPRPRVERNFRDLAKAPEGGRTPRRCAFTKCSGPRTRVLNCGGKAAAATPLSHGRAVSISQPASCARRRRGSSLPAALQDAARDLIVAVSLCLASPKFVVDYLNGSLLRTCARH